MICSRCRACLSLLVIVIVVSLLSGCQDGSESLSAEEYFDALLRQRGYPTEGLPLEEVQETSARLGIPVPEGQLSEVARASGPKGKLRPFLDDLVRNLPDHHRQELPTLFVGEIPWGDMNAHILRAPDGSLLILVGRDLSIALYEWAKLLVNMILIFQPDPESPPDASLEELVERFSNSVKHYAETSEVLRQSAFATDKKGMMASVLSASATQFVLAHEYSHAALGHVDDAPDVATAKVLDPGPLPPGHWQREAAADRFAAELLLRDSDSWMFDMDLKAAGILYAVGTLEAIERMEGRRDSRQFAGRLQLLEELLNVSDQAETLPFASMVAEAMQLVSENLKDLPSYISGENLPDLPRHISGSTQGFDTAYSPREGTSKPARLGATDLRNLLDKRDAVPSTNAHAFNSFMLRFYAAHQAGDWSTMQTLAVNERNLESYFDQLAAYGLLSAFEGAASYDVPWDSRMALDSLGWAELAMSLVAASQHKESPGDSKLRQEQLEILEAIWRRLYVVSLVRAGARADPPPGVSIQEALDKSANAAQMGVLLADPELATMSVVAAAWILERTDEHEKARKLLDQLFVDGVLPEGAWPPITREEGEFRFALPARFQRLEARAGSDARLSELTLSGHRLVIEGRYEEAQKTWTEALEISERDLGPEHPTTAMVLNYLASTLRYRGRHTEAEELYRRSLAIYEEAHGPADPRIVASLGNLAGVLRVLGRAEEAERLYDRGIRLLKGTTGPATLEMAYLANNLAELYREQGRYSEARPLYRTALGLRRDLLGGDDPEYAKTLINLGLLYTAEGRLREAESMYRDGVSVLERALGDEHPDLAVGLLNLAALLQRLGRYEESERLLLRALEIATPRLGPMHPFVGTCWNNLGGLFQALERTEEAREAYQRALRIRESAWGPGHQTVLQTRDNLRSLESDRHDRPRPPQ